jgi:acetyltransferase
MAATLRRELKEGGYVGQVTWLDIEMTGTLADLAHSRADLALIALPASRPPPRWRSSAASAAARR